MLMTITRCTVSDLKALQTISIDTFYETYHADNTEKNIRDYLAVAFTDEKLTQELENPHSQFYLLHVEQAVAGYLKVNELSAQSEAMGDDALELERIYVDKAFQKQGLGKVLMNKALSIATQLGKTRIWLGVWEKNDNAIAFYEKQDFEKAGSHEFYMGDEKQMDHIMAKTL
ncbi:MAG: N-acetyltransferase [Solibacillus sp.]